MAEVESEKKFKSRVSLNILMNLIRTALTAIIGLLMVPYYLSSLGISVYAIIPLATSITTYVLALTDPLSAAFARYMFQAIREGNEEEINKTYNTAVFGMGRVVLALVPVCLIISFVAPFVFDTGSATDLEVQILFAMVLISSMIITFSSCLGCIFEAYNKIYISYGIQTIYCILQVTIIVLLFTETGATLDSIGIAYLIASLVMLACMAFFAKRTCPTLHISRKYYDGTIIKKLLGLGLWIVISNIGSMLYIDTSMIICNLMMGSAEQGTFAIAANAISMIGTTANTVSAVVVPLIYDAYTKGNIDELLSTLRFFIKFIGVLIALPIGYVLIFLPQIIETWLGTGYDAIYPMLYIMLPGHVAVCSVKALYYVSTAYEKVKPSAIGMISFGIVNILLAISLVSFTDLGTWGICIAWSASMVMSHVGFTVCYSSYLMKIKRRRLYSCILFSYVPFLVLIGVGFAFTNFYTIHSNWISIILAFAIISVIYLPVAIRFSFSKDEKKMMKSFMPEKAQKLLRI